MQEATCKQFDPGSCQLCGFRSDRTMGAVDCHDSIGNKGALEYISILPLMRPEIILGMVGWHFLYAEPPFGMLTLLIGHTVFCIPYILMEVKARLVGMDPSLRSRRDLGATSLRAFFDITLPPYYAGCGIWLITCICHVHGRCGDQYLLLMVRDCPPCRSRCTLR